MKRIISFILLIALTLTVCGCSVLEELSYPPLEERYKEGCVSFIEAFLTAARALDGNTLKNMYANELYMLEASQWLNQQPNVPEEVASGFWATTIVSHMFGKDADYSAEQLKKMTIAINRDTMRGNPSSFIEVDANIGFEDDPSKGKPAVITIQIMKSNVGSSSRPVIFHIIFSE